MVKWLITRINVIANWLHSDFKVIAHSLSNYWNVIEKSYCVKCSTWNIELLVTVANDIGLG